MNNKETMYTSVDMHVEVDIRKNLVETFTVKIIFMILKIMVCFMCKQYFIQYTVHTNILNSNIRENVLLLN